MYQTFDQYYLEIETIFMNNGNRNTDKSHMFRLILSGQLDFKNPNENITLANLSICYTWKNIKSEYNNNKLKICSNLEW